MFLAIILALAWMLLWVTEQTTFHETAIGLMFTGILALNAIYDKVEALLKLLDGKD